MLNKLKIIFSFSFFLFSLSFLPALAANDVTFDDNSSSIIAGALASFPLVQAVVSPSTSTPVIGNSSSTSSFEPFILNFNKETVLKGYSLKAFLGEFKLSLPAGAFKDGVNLEVKVIDEDMPAPWKLERVSPFYQFDFKPESVYDNKKSLTLEIAYNDDTSAYKRVFFFDNNFQSWRELPTIDSPDKKTVTAKISLPFARVAVFSDPLIKTAGKSSWYAYKKGNFAASIDFPKGSKLRVYNLDNNKSVDVVINDFGPERDKFPDRILDLDKVAFKKIAKAGAGIVNIRIQPLFVAPDAGGRVLGVSEKGALSEPDIKADSAIVMNEKTSEVIWEKNPDAVLPLASLSKIAAIKVFFDQQPTLSTVVTYKKQDELYNYQYCKPSESAKLEVKDSETMTTENLVYAALVGSANNAVESLVRVSGLSREVFIAKMNDFAASVGATSTHFEEPTGLSPNNVSTAKEYAILTAEIFKNPFIQRVSVTPKYKFTTINTKKPHVMSNTNNFIRDGVFAASNNLKVTGSKTGYLDKYNLMTRTHAPSGEDLIAIDFGAVTKFQSLEETKELLQYGMRKAK
jgi:serine-type D-Ala-D-Ala endopeptidase (penicillin-binding protein 7)